VQAPIEKEVVDEIFGQVPIFDESACEEHQLDHLSKEDSIKRKQYK
jgi:hypothetical protein